MEASDTPIIPGQRAPFHLNAGKLGDFPRWIQAEAGQTGPLGTSYEAEYYMNTVTLTLSPSNDLYNYTSAEVAIYNILDQGTLRLSPYEFTNDPEENRPRVPGLSGPGQGSDDEDPGSIWGEADWWLRRYAKVACLTQDFEIFPADYADDENALRGWAHPALWAHYGASHGGACLRFDRNKIIEQFESQMGSRGQCFYGAVEYPFQRFFAPPGSLDIDQIREFGVDAVVSFYIDKYHKELFFTKHHDWENEREFRLLLNEPSLMPAYLDIRDCLAGVVLGASFPASMLDRIQHIRDAWPNLDIAQLQYVNGKVFRLPVPPTAARNSIRARRDGPFAARLQELRSLEEQRNRARANGETVAAGPLSRMTASISATQSACSAWSSVEAQAYQRNRAIPPEQYGKSPGVPGEVVEFQRGWMCVVENLPKQSCTLTISLAIQLLDTGMVRLHGLIDLEKWVAPENERSTLWRKSYETALCDAAGTVDVLIQELESQVRPAQKKFNACRGLS
jgi:hypothetical protein